jgi:hypothetical protein
LLIGAAVCANEFIGIFATIKMVTSIVDSLKNWLDINRISSLEFFTPPTEAAFFIRAAPNSENPLPSVVDTS